MREVVHWYVENVADDVAHRAGISSSIGGSRFVLRLCDKMVVHRGGTHVGGYEVPVEIGNVLTNWPVFELVDAVFDIFAKFFEEIIISVRKEEMTPMNSPAQVIPQFEKWVSLAATAMSSAMELSMIPGTTMQKAFLWAFVRPASAVLALEKLSA